MWFVFCVEEGLCVVCITFTDWFRGRTSVWFV